MTLASPIRWLQPSADLWAAAGTPAAGDWSELPAIGRAAGELKLTAASRAFVGGLASRRPPGAALAPLSHGRSLEAPRGLVHGIARVRNGGRRHGPDLTPAPPDTVRRRRAAAGPAPLGPAADERGPAPELAATAGGEVEPADEAVPLHGASDDDREPALPAAAEAVALATLEPARPRLRVLRPLEGAGRATATAPTAVLTRVPEAAPIPTPSGLVSPAPPASPGPTASAVAGEVAGVGAADTSLPAPPEIAAADLTSDFRPRRLRGALRSLSGSVAPEPESEPGHERDVARGPVADPSGEVRPAPAGATPTVADSTESRPPRPVVSARLHVPRSEAAAAPTSGSAPVEVRRVAAPAAAASDSAPGPRSAPSPATPAKVARAPDPARPAPDQAPTGGEEVDAAPGPSPAVPVDPVGSAVVTPGADDELAESPVETSEPRSAAGRPGAPVQPDRESAHAGPGTRRAVERSEAAGPPAPAASTPVHRRAVVIPERSAQRQDDGARELVVPPREAGPSRSEVAAGLPGGTDDSPPPPASEARRQASGKTSPQAAERASAALAPSRAVGSPLAPEAAHRRPTPDTAAPAPPAADAGRRAAAPDTPRLARRTQQSRTGSAPDVQREMPLTSAHRAVNSLGPAPDAADGSTSGDVTVAREPKHVPAGLRAKAARPAPRAASPVVRTGAADRPAGRETPLSQTRGDGPATGRAATAATTDVSRRAKGAQASASAAPILPAPADETSRPPTPDDSHAADLPRAATTVEMPREPSTPAGPPPRRPAAPVARASVADVPAAAAGESPGQTRDEPRTAHPVAEAADVRVPAPQSTSSPVAPTRGPAADPAPPGTTDAPARVGTHASAPSAPPVRRAATPVVPARAFDPPALTSDAPLARSGGRARAAEPAATTPTSSADTSVGLARKLDTPGPAPATPDTGPGDSVPTRAPDSPMPTAADADPERTPFLPPRSRAVGPAAGDARAVLDMQPAAGATAPTDGAAAAADAQGRPTLPPRERRSGVSESAPPEEVAPSPAPHNPLQRATRPALPLDRRVVATPATTGATATPLAADGLLHAADGAGRSPSGAPIRIERTPITPRPGRPAAPAPTGATATPLAADGLLQAADGAGRSPSAAPIRIERTPITPRPGRPVAPALPGHEHAADAGPALAEAGTTSRPHVRPVPREPSFAVRRPGLDFHAVLGAPGGSSVAVADVPARRVAEPVAGPRVQAARTASVADAVPSRVVARRPGLDVARALSVSRSEAASPVARARSEPALMRLESDRPPPLAQLRLAPTPAPAASSAPAAGPFAPAPLVALPSPPASPPASVQRVTSWDGPDDTPRGRLGEAPDDELQELADRLYDHIRARFRTELMIDRERAGLLADRY